MQNALQEQRPVVALESTVIAHGLPYPANIEAASAMEQAIRAEGAVPATIAIDQGQIRIGLSSAEIERLASATEVQKVSRRDLAVTLDKEDRVTWYSIESENFESIHNHNAYAMIERDKREG